MKQVIVTGANGFIGSSLIARLVNEKIAVLAIDISFEPSNLPKSELVTELTLSLDSVDAMLKAIPKGTYDTFFHFAWKGVNGPDKADPTVQLHNIDMAVNCAKVAKALGCAKLLCAGTIAEQAVHSLTHLEKTAGGMMYGVVKNAAHTILDAYCKNIGLHLVWMQFSNIYGAKNRTGNLISYTLGELTEGRAATFGPAAQPYDFVFVGDLIEAVYRLGAEKTRKNFYFIGSGKPRLLKDYLLEIGRAVDKEALIRIGERPDDGILYSYDMFDISALTEEIGEYVSSDFEVRIRETAANLAKGEKE